MGTFRRTVPELAWALTGQCTEHHGRLSQGALALMALLERQSADRDEPMRQATEPCAPQLEQLQSLLGLKAVTACDLIAESGAARRRLGSATRVSAWAGRSPGHNERAGKRRQGRTRQGHRSLRRVVVPCAWAARKTSTFVGRTLRRLASRLGRKQAAMAVAHTIVVSISPVRMDGTFYEESRDDRHEAREEERDKQRALAALARWGYAVTWSPVRETAPDYSTSVGCSPLVVSVWGPKRRRLGTGAPRRRKNFVGNAHALLRRPLGSAPQHGAARLWLVLDMRLRMGKGSASGVPWGEGLGRLDGFWLTTS